MSPTHPNPCLRDLQRRRTGSPAPRAARLLLAGWLLGLFPCPGATPGQPTDIVSPHQVLRIDGSAMLRPAGTDRWVPLAQGTRLQYGDQVRTGSRSRVTFLDTRRRSQWVLDESGRTQVAGQPTRPIIRLLDRARIYFFHRGPPQDAMFEGGEANAGVEGTEFAISLEPDGTLTLILFDGQVVLSNPEGTLRIESGEIAVARPGRAPAKQSAVLTYGDFSLIQWAIFYPGVLDLDELAWVAPPEPAIHDSLAAYRRGNLPAALSAYPPERQPVSDPERVYLAAIVLASGGVEEARTLLGGLSDDPSMRRLAAALHQLIAAVLRQDCHPHSEEGPVLATELLAASYCHQSRGHLQEALDAARQATELAPGFGFAWARRAELEFSFGRVRPASGMIARAMTLTPENAAALTLQGFVATAQNRIAQGQASFEQAIALDGALGNAWLGLGLCRIRLGDLEGGRSDLLTAAALEPQRSLLRSYLGKAYADSHLFRTPALAERARHEWELARRLDPQDPTPWLYQSLAQREENRINDAIRSLDRAQDLTGHRGLYRSRLLLDQDRAVTGANQALAYRDAGMTDVAVRAASRAVSTDYANPAAHQFLAESYAQATPTGLRYETPRLSEYLVANLLAPVGAGLLSPTLSQQEYSKLFERDRTGLFSQTTYLSRGAWSQYGGVTDTHGGTSLLAEGFYYSDPGYAPNNDVEQYGFTLQLKQQISPRDTVYGQVFYTDLDAGDIALRYDPQVVNPDVRATERVWPSVVGGWHRAWSPEHHSLFLAGWVEGKFEAVNRLPPTPVRPAARIASYRSDPGILTTEAQHLWTPERHTVVAGVRWQSGEFEIDYRERTLAGLERIGVNYRPDFDRIQLYAYETWQILNPLYLTAGVSYDNIQFPLNHTEPRLQDAEERRSQVSPKVGAMWEVIPRTWLRTAYTRSLGGASYEQSFRLEPTQVAGFNQAFRSLMPESVARTAPATTFETAGVGFETRLATNLWLNVTGERLESKGYEIRDMGPGSHFPPLWQTEQRRFEEHSLQTSIHHLIDEHVSLGARYRISESELDRGEAWGNPSDEATLQSLSLSAHFNHRSGLFASIEGLWMHQHNGRMYYPGIPGSSGTVAAVPSEDLWQINLWGGWRFLRRRAEILVGVLNVTDADYRLNPISVTVPPERERTFITRLSFHY